MAFVMVLSWSRQIYLRFFLDARMDSFLAGHAGAFAAWSGVPRCPKYDNLRSAVLERQGDAIRFNPALLAFAAIIATNPGRWPSQRKRKGVRRILHLISHDRGYLRLQPLCVELCSCARTFWERRRQGARRGTGRYRYIGMP